MKITINQRISAGFGLLVILMLLMSFSSYQGIKQLNDQMTRSGEQVTPMLVTCGAMGVALLSANKTLMQFLASNNPKQLTAHNATFKQQQDEYHQRRADLETLSITYPEISDNLSLSNKDGDAFLKGSQEIRNLHL